LGALSADIRADTGWYNILIFASFSAALLISGVISRWAGRSIDKWGGRRVMAIGSVLSAIGCGILSVATHPAIYVAGWLVLGPAMRLTLYDAAFPALAQIAGERSRRAISYLTLFGGLASTVFWLTSHFLSEAIGWHYTFLVYAACISSSACRSICSCSMAGTGSPVKRARHRRRQRIHCSPGVSAHRQ
jgi:MFS family permease